MLTLDWPSKDAYEKRLFSSHDYAIEVDVLDFNERTIGTASFLDGSITINEPSNLIRRGANLLLSDPDGALDFSAASAWSGTSIWADRLIRIRHILVVAGREVEAPCFVGPPASLSRSGAEVSVTCDDKAALAMRGSVPYTVKTGMNAVDAIRAILRDCTGEFRFRFPTSPRRLSKDYSVGLDDASSPMVKAAQIARVELGMQLLYAADGAALLRVLPASPSMTVLSGVTEQASSDADFTAFNNYVKVTGKATTKTSGKTTIKTQPVAVAQIAPSSNLSPQGLARKGVPIYRPMVISDDSYTKTEQVKDRANAELNKVDQITSSTQFSCVPFFHADADDLVIVPISDGSQRVRLSTGTIPLGIEGDMTIGVTRAATRQPKHKSRVAVYRWKKRLTGPKKHRKTHWDPI